MTDTTRTLTSAGAWGHPEVPLELLVRGPSGLRHVALPGNGVFTVGRDPSAGLQIDDACVSRTHLALHLGAGTYIEDLGSRNGTQISGMRLQAAERRPLFAGEVVVIGPYSLWVQRTGEPPAPWEDARFEQALRGSSSFTWVRFEVPELWDRVACLLALSGAAGREGGFRILDGALDLLGDGAVDAEAVAASLRTSATVRRWAAVRSEEGEPAELEALLLARLSGPAPEAASRAQMLAVDELMERVAPGRLPVLILGETGVGKDVAARELHRRSRRSGSFVSVNCAALNEALLESELFGYERGAFTGADRAKPGLIESASGGTLFLDEIAELPLATQAKLLHVLEQQRMLRVGGVTPREIDVRFIAATNRDLVTEVRARRFREDLYYRVAGITLDVPPLRRRRAEILSLAEHFIAGRRRLSGAARDALQNFSWPGNVRELRNVVERAVLLSSGPTIDPPHLRLDSAAPLLRIDPSQGGEPEKLRILQALNEAAGNQTQAAKALGMSRSAFVARLGRFGIPRPRK